MNLKKILHKKIIQTSEIPQKNGYVDTYKDNLVPGIEEKYFVNDLKSGAGNELHSKFKALWSSSALAVNNFVPFVKYVGKINFIDTIFCKAKFEEPFSTGLGGTPPNLDFYMENSNLVVGFESKFLEIITETKSEFKEKYFSIKYLNKDFINLMKEYNNKKYYLHAAQLLKHSIGLINHQKKHGKDIILYYIYWTPLNWHEFDEYNKHENELKTFTQEINSTNQIRFVTIKYTEFWNIYENNILLNEHIKNIRKRYEFSIQNCVRSVPLREKSV